MGRVVVIGGGLAGITAALDCADAGAEVILVEVRPRLGGAAYSFERDGLWLDNGQHVFLRCCDAYRALLHRLGSTDSVTLQRRLEIPVLAPGGKVAWLRRTRLPAPAHLAGSLLRYGHLRPSERIRAAQAALALGRVDRDDPAAENRSFGAWLGEHHQSPRSIDALWELIARPTLNLSANDASLAAAAFVFQVGLLERADAGDIGYARVPLQKVHGDAALQVLRKAGVDVRLRWRAQGVELGCDGALTVNGAEPSLPANAVILAVPHDRAAGLLPDGAIEDQGSLANLGSSPIVNLHIVFNRPVFGYDFAATVNSPLQFVFDRTSSSGLERGQCLAVSLSAADEEAAMGSEELRRRFIAALEALLPAARDARVENFVITREHAATLRAVPGSRGLRPAAQTALPGLALAGAWTDTGWPATMEGAVRSGHAAARVALAALKRERRVEPAAA